MANNGTNAGLLGFLLTLSALGSPRAEAGLAPAAGGNALEGRLHRLTDAFRQSEGYLHVSDANAVYVGAAFLNSTPSFRNVVSGWLNRVSGWHNAGTFYNSGVKFLNNASGFRNAYSGWPNHVSGWLNGGGFRNGGGFVNGGFHNGGFANGGGFRNGGGFYNR